MSIPFLEVGYILPLGKHLFTREDIIAFARKYDPQPFHLSDEGAAGTHFGRLAASGWHTASVGMRKLIDARQKQAEEAAEQGVILPKFGPSPGIRDLKWSKPVFANDVITYSSQLVDKRESRSKPGLWVISSVLTGVNQEGTRVIEYGGAALIDFCDKP